jgi:uncharacterized membrane protein (DUF4010 family)
MGMSSIDLLGRLALALAIGLLVGVERGWQERELKDGARAAGTRTYALIGLLGGIAAAVQITVGGFVLAAALPAFAGTFAVFALREARLGGVASATSMVTGIVVFVLGALAVADGTMVAGVAGIATTIILAERKSIHAFVARLTWAELRSALLLLVMTFVLLPMLPDRTVDPWNALNPRQLWLMMIAVAAISYVGYICVRILGDRAGLILAATAGGLVSSTAVTLAYARLSRLHPQNAVPLSAGITASWTVSLLRMSTIACVLAPALIQPLLTLLGPPALLLAAATAFLSRRTASAEASTPLELNDPFELGEVIKFGLLLAVVSIASKLLGATSGTLTLFPLAAVTGLVDVDPITISVAKLTGSGLPLHEAAQVILMAATANLVCKTAVATLLGSRSLTLRMVAVSAVTAVATGVVLVVSRMLP